jgi:hypothetical protein
LSPEMAPVHHAPPYKAKDPQTRETPIKAIRQYQLSPMKYLSLLTIAVIKKDVTRTTKGDRGVRTKSWTLNETEAVHVFERKR